MTTVPKAGINPTKCRHSEKCRTKNCTFTHDTPPEGHLKGNKTNDCKYDRNCKRQECFYDHVNGRIIDEVDAVMNGIQSEDDLINSIEALLSEANEQLYSKEGRKYQLISGDDCDSDESEDGEPVLDIVTQKKTKEFELQKEEFRLAVSAIQQRFNCLNRSEDDHTSAIIHNVYKQLQREMKHWKFHLPIYAHRTALVKSLQDNQILILKADTGSGKSTQIVQYLCNEQSSNNSKSFFFLKATLINWFSRFRTNRLYTAAKVGSKNISSSSRGRIWLPTWRRSKLYRVSQKSPRKVFSYIFTTLISTNNFFLNDRWI
jgi:hypothetical protein